VNLEIWMPFSSTCSSGRLAMFVLVMRGGVAQKQGSFKLMHLGYRYCTQVTDAKLDWDQLHVSEGITTILLYNFLALFHSFEPISASVSMPASSACICWLRGRVSDLIGQYMAGMSKAFLPATCIYK